MRNPHPKYMCYPSVVPTCEKTEVTVFPRDISRVFSEDKQYSLLVIGMCDDLPDYHVSLPFDVPCRVENGCLKFTYTFEKEQEYSIRFKEGDKKEIRIPMYALERDLYELRPLKCEFHTHSYYSDGGDGAAMVAADYREEGFDSFALTDHNRMFTSELLPSLYDGIPLGISMLHGEEVHTPGSKLHIVHIGGSYSVCEKYIKHREQFEKDVAEIEKTIMDVSEQYRYRLASAIWSCREIKKAGGVSIFAHPFWKSNIYNVSSEFCDLLFDAKIFDVFELFNGANTHLDNLQLSLWLEQIQKGNVLPVVASSDSHNHDFGKDGFARSFTVVFAKDNTSESIKTAVKNGMGVAAEISRDADEDIRFYCSSHRLVALSRFLWDNYFNETWRLCVGEGILMRRHAEGEDVSTALAALADTVENFYNRFYGKTKVDGLSKDRLEFLDTLRKAQRDSGLKTKGSSLEIYGGNECRE
ncbi:MAG: PHP domain-containing protein [Clostridia bacterium]|nr:PHP domain-containing protein [Clostridia bacterium]